MIRLFRTVTVSCFDLEGVIARSQDRPELLAVAQLAHDSPRGLTADILANELIGGQSILCRRIIDRCVALGVLERQRVGAPARLSEIGRAMLQRGQIWIPERGTWRLYFADDPLLDARPVHVEPCWTPSAKATRGEVYRQKDKGERPAQGQARPRLLRDLDPGELYASLVDGSTFQLVSLADHGAPGRRSDLHLSWAFPAEGEARVTASAQLEAPPCPPKTPQRAIEFERVLELPRALAGWTYDQLWTQLISVARGLDPKALEAACEWAGRLILPVTFEHASDAERRNMRTRVEVPAIRFPSAGEFQPTHIDPVELVPHSTDDASEWARWLQWDAIQSYAVPAQLERDAQRIRERFPLFQVRSASADELLAQAKLRSGEPTSRHLLTTSDLGLWS